MHNIAIALAKKGYAVSGSDDAIYDPSYSRLKDRNILPQSFGWDASRITKDLDIVILGMHARKNNPELAEAQKLGIPIVSFPEFVASESENKKRIVVAGSHGKTTTTAMLMHVLSKLAIEFDYVVGSSVDGFDVSVRFSDAPIILIEGDEYLSSPLDLTSKFHWYNPHISIITGIAYDHINVFPTFEGYVNTFADFVENHESESVCFWFNRDEHLQKIMKDTKKRNVAYTTPNYEFSNNTSVVKKEENNYPLEVVGKHNLENLEAAYLVCKELGVSEENFFNAAADFSGAGKRMEKIYTSDNQVVYRDFAHSPSKLNATTDAVKEAYKGNLTAVFELHTFSSLNIEFLPYYKDSMQAADQAIVFYNEAVFEHKKMPFMSREFVKSCFGNIEVINEPEDLELIVNTAFEKGNNLLLMSSGKFNGASFKFD